MFNFNIFFCISIDSEQWWCTEYTEYADEIHAVLRKREYERIGFEYKSPQIRWRMHLLQFILDVARQHNLARETIHLGKRENLLKSIDWIANCVCVFFFISAVYIMDIFMDNNQIRLWRLYLVALTALRIAAKVEEKDFTASRVEALNSCKLCV